MDGLRALIDLLNRLGAPSRPSSSPAAARPLPANPPAPGPAAAHTTPLPAKNSKTLDLAGKIVAAMRRHSIPVETDPACVTIVYVEGLDPPSKDFPDGKANANRPNAFDDCRCVIRFAPNGTPTLAGAWAATTHPGAYWTAHPMNDAGAAHIALGYHRAWQVGFHHGDPDHEALVQTGGPVTVVRSRDPAKDYARIGVSDTGSFGINQHRAYGEPRDDLGHSSAGCLVAWSRDGHEAFKRLVKSDRRYLADRRYVFDTTVMPRAWLDEP
jgi:hypothetical protein